MRTDPPDWAAWETLPGCGAAGVESPAGGGRRLCVVDEDGSPLLTIGQLASRTGLAVRTIRYWSDIGAVPPAGRRSGGHRLYDAGSVARLERGRRLAG